MKYKDFKATYYDNGTRKCKIFSHEAYDQQSASEELAGEGVKNFMFFFEPLAPIELPNNEVLLRGDVGYDINAEIMQPFLSEGKGIKLDSFGGDLWTGLQIYDMVKGSYPDAKIGILGSCASAATVIFCSAKKENRSMSNNSRFLIHNALFDHVYGNHHQLRAAADMIEKESNNIVDNIYVPDTLQTPEDLHAVMDREAWLNKNETIALGFLNENQTKTDINNAKSDKTKDEELNEMDKKQIKDTMSAIDETLKKVRACLGTKVLNITLQDVNGVELDFPDITDEAEIAVGVTVTADGQPAEGEYVMPDGATIVCEGGLITEIKPKVEEEEAPDAPAEDPEQLKAENEALKAEIEELKSAKNAVDDELTTVKASIADYKAEIKALKEGLTAASTQLENIKSHFPGFDANGAENNTTTVNNRNTKKKFSYKSKK